MHRKQWVVLSFIALAAAFIGWLAWSSRQPPLLPDDDVHAAFDNAATCRQCHGPDGTSPQSPQHPLGDDCVRCHGRR